MADKKVKVTLVKSLIGSVPKNRAIANSMGLRKIGDKSTQPVNDATKGKLAHICYLVEVKEL